MINANELRRGVLVEFEGSVYPIASIAIDDTIRLASDNIDHPNYDYGTIGCYSINKIKPIPLTEERLLKFGFEITERTSNFIRYEKVFEKVDVDYGGDRTFEICYHSIYPKYVLLNDSYEREIKYIHQLQNLYFALTGEELTIIN